MNTSNVADRSSGPVGTIALCNAECHQELSISPDPITINHMLVIQRTSHINEYPSNPPSMFPLLSSVC